MRRMPQILMFAKYVDRNWEYVIRIKEGGSPKLFEWFEQRKAQGRVHLYEYADPKTGTIHRYQWSNNLPLNETFNTLKNQGYNFEHNYGDMDTSIYV